MPNDYLGPIQRKVAYDSTGGIAPEQNKDKDSLELDGKRAPTLTVQAPAGSQFAILNPVDHANVLFRAAKEEFKKLDNSGASDVQKLNKMRQLAVAAKPHLNLDSPKAKRLFLPKRIQELNTAFRDLESSNADETACRNFIQALMVSPAEIAKALQLETRDEHTLLIRTNSEAQINQEILRHVKISVEERSALMRKLFENREPEEISDITNHLLELFKGSLADKDTKGTTDEQGKALLDLVSALVEEKYLERHNLVEAVQTELGDSGKKTAGKVLDAWSRFQENRDTPKEFEKLLTTLNMSEGDQHRLKDNFHQLQNEQEQRDVKKYVVRLSKDRLSVNRHAFDTLSFYLLSESLCNIPDDVERQSFVQDLQDLCKNRSGPFYHVESLASLLAEVSSDKRRDLVSQIKNLITQRSGDLLSVGKLVLAYVNLPDDKHADFFRNLEKTLGNQSHEDVNYIAIFAKLLGSGTIQALPEFAENTRKLHTYLEEEEEDLYSIKEIISKGADPNVRFPETHERYPKLALNQAAFIKNEFDLLKFLIEKGADPNVEFPEEQRWYSKFTLIQAALIQHKFDLLKFLIEKGADPNVKFPETHRLYPGWTLAQAAVAEGDLDLVKFLIGKGANFDPNVEFHEEHWRYPKFTLIQTAFIEHKFDLLKFLIEKGADLNVKFPETYKEYSGLTLAQFSSKVNKRVQSSMKLLEELFGDNEETLAAFNDHLERIFYLDGNLDKLLDFYEEYKTGHFTKLGSSKKIKSEDLPLFLEIFRKIISEELGKTTEKQKKFFKRNIDSFKRSAAAAQFSGALYWAHRHGIIGKEVAICVFEPKDHEHAYHVSGIVKQLAPGGNIKKISFNSLNNVIPKNTRIINASFGSTTLTETTPALINAIESGKLVVKASGNDGKPLDLGQDNPERASDQNYLLKLNDEKRGRLILTGNLKAGNVQNSSSNKPGKHPEINEHFLWTLGSDVLSDISDTKTGQRSGTSMSAPIVTGAAALVQGAYPNFTHEQVKECLLESADQDFWIHEENGKSTHVVPSELFKEEPNTEKYDKAKWGKGVLNIKRALQYAELKAKNTEKNSKEIRLELDKKDKEEASASATKIQKLYRSFLQRPIQL